MFDDIFSIDRKNYFLNDKRIFRSKTRFIILFTEFPIKHKNRAGPYVVDEHDLGYRIPAVALRLHTTLPNYFSLSSI